MAMAINLPSKTSLQKSLAHYKQAARDRNRLKAHYAMGVVDVLRKIDGLRGGLRDEMKRLWHGRGNPAIASQYYITKEFVSMLDDLMDESEAADEPR